MAHIYPHPIAVRFHRAARTAAAILCLTLFAAYATPAQPGRQAITQDRINEIAAALLDLPTHYAGLTARRKSSETPAQYATRLREYVEAAVRAARITAPLKTAPALRDTSPGNVQRWRLLAAQCERLGQMSVQAKRSVAELLKGGKPSADARVLAETGSKLVAVLDTTNAIVQGLRDATP